jgi:predicted O-methyltransferase YrrM
VKRGLRFLWSLRALPPRVAVFQWRAWRLAFREGDGFSVVSPVRPANLAVLLEVSRGRTHAAELGTGTAWTSISLLLSDPARELVSYDPYERPERELYLGLVDPELRRRLRFVHAPGSDGPPDDSRFDLLYIDSSHECEDTVREVEAWRPALAPGALIVFDDFDHPGYPGVRQAIAELGLAGEQRANMFVHRVPA